MRVRRQQFQWRATLLRAWLITWEWNGPTASVVDKVAAILSPRRSRAHIAAVVELLYVQATASVERLAAYARDPQSIPYHARFEYNGRIICGSSPWLHAEKVENLIVKVDPETHVETISWRTLALYDPAVHPDGQPVIPSVSHTCERIIQGPLSSERRWDPLRDQFKPQFAPRTAA